MKTLILIFSLTVLPISILAQSSNQVERMSKWFAGGGINFANSSADLFFGRDISKFSSFVAYDGGEKFGLGSSVKIRTEIIAIRFGNLVFDKQNFSENGFVALLWLNPLPLWIKENKKLILKIAITHPLHYEDINPKIVFGLIFRKNI